MTTYPPRRILTYTGRMVDPLAMTAADVCVADIAHALSQKCRFTGHTVPFFSVAEHCLDVAAAVADNGGTPQEQLWALLHDAGEAYLPDVAAPIKDFFYVQDGNMKRPFRWVEDWILDAVAEHLGLSGCFPAIVNDADKACCAVELDELMTGPGEDVTAPMPTMSPIEAEAAWLQAVAELVEVIER